ncbi:hypothetical protein [Alkaliphilus transvaalensis]|uniref:hypothetical protein n=1 Tax=Alkaliphilus transvaalensis TaxID=114628 RepID=UPI00047ACD40|nr:hypothetical protein [Alkaliphilus transvaalensis]
MEILIVVAIIVILFLIYFVPLYRRTKNLEKMLNKGTNLSAYISEVEAHINKTKNKKYQNFLLINKASGLVALGKYKEAVNLLKVFDNKDLKELPKVYIVQYYSNLLYGLLITEKHEEAERLYAATYKLLSGYINHRALRNLLLSTFGTYEYYLGNVNKSKELLNELFKSKELTPLQRISSLYYLGMLDLKDDNASDAKNKFDEILKVEHDNPYFKKQASNQLKNLE